MWRDWRCDSRLIRRCTMNMQISAPGPLPVTPQLQQVLDLCFDSVYALFGFSINVSVKAAVSAAVFPLETGSPPAGAFCLYNRWSCHVPAFVQHLVACYQVSCCFAAGNERSPCSIAGSRARQPGAAAQPPPKAGAKRARQLLQSAPRYNATAAARYSAVRPYCQLYDDVGSSRIALQELWHTDIRTVKS